MRPRLFFFLMCLAMAAFAQDHTFYARNHLREFLMSPSLLTEGRVEYIDRGAPYPRVRMKVYAIDEYFYVAFTAEKNERFPLLQPLTTVFRYPKAQAEIDQIKIFHTENEDDNFLRIRKRGQLSEIQWVLQGQQLERARSLPLSMEELITYNWTNLPRDYPSLLPWEVVFPFYKRSNSLVANMVHMIREALLPIPEVYDGALDDQGWFVEIATGEPQVGAAGFNCSGMVKWLADGVMQALGQNPFTLETLKFRNTNLRGSNAGAGFEELRDPYFGLDWIWNITRGIYEALNRPVQDPQQKEIRDFPYLAYVEDRGYPMEYLESVLFWEAARNPGYFYLLSVNGEFGRDPVLVQHRHVSSVFPYFTPDGAYHQVVFDVNEERTMASLLERYPGHKVVIIAIPAQENLELQNLSPGDLVSR